MCRDAIHRVHLRTRRESDRCRDALHRVHLRTRRESGRCRDAIHRVHLRTRRESGRCRDALHRVHLRTRRESAWAAGRDESRPYTILAHSFLKVYHRVLPTWDVHRSAGRDESRPYNDPMHRGRRNDEHTSDNGESFCRDAIHSPHIH